MNVEMLQSYFRNLAGVLEQTDGRRAAEDLAAICRGLEPFKQVNLTDFAEFLIKAEQYTRDPNLLQLSQGRERKSAKSLNPETVRAAALEIRTLQERATDGTLPIADIKNQVDRMGRKLSKTEAVEVAREVGIISEQPLSKSEALEKIRMLIEDRQRIENRGQGMPATARPTMPSTERSEAIAQTP
jgi:hypothetical protein